jgi:peptidoglycan/LPS O-acetylase OafA/YrhL
MKHSMSAAVSRGSVSLAPVIRLGGHLPQLDGLRGLAILLVMLFHFGNAVRRVEPMHEGAPQVVARVLQCGWLGVELFFVLSGFLITGILLDSRRERGYFRSFFARRFLRIFPLYYGLLIGAVLLVPLVLGATSVKHAYLLDHQTWYWTYTTNYLIAREGGFITPSWGFFWSLAVEEQFYLIWPLVVWCTSRRTLTGICCLLFLASLTARAALLIFGLSPDAVYPLTFAHMEPLAIGALLALLMRGGLVLCPRRLRFARLAGWVCLAGMLSLFVSLGTFPFWETMPVIFGISLGAVAFGQLLIASLLAQETSLLARCLLSAPMQSLGRLSYGVYVFHSFVGHGVVRYFIRPGDSSSAYYPLKLVAFFLFASLASWGVAWLSWHLYEKHFSKLKKYFPVRKAVPQRAEEFPVGAAAFAAGRPSPAGPAPAVALRQELAV